MRGAVRPHELPRLAPAGELSGKFEDDYLRGLTEFELFVGYEFGQMKLKVLRGKNVELRVPTPEAKATEPGLRLRNHHFPPARVDPIPYSGYQVMLL